MALGTALSARKRVFFVRRLSASFIAAGKPLPRAAKTLNTEHRKLFTKHQTRNFF
jgi:hypothetical protein